MTTLRQRATLLLASSGSLIFMIIETAPRVRY